MNCVPALPVLAPKPPTFDTTCATSGSARTIAFICSWRAFIAGYEMSCGPRVLPMIMPVSCCGNWPNGILNSRNTLSAIVASVITPTMARWRNTNASARP